MKTGRVRDAPHNLLFWDSIAANLFVETGHAWEDATEDMDLQYSAGGELHVNIGYNYGRLPLDIHVGGAYGFDEDEGETQVYFTFTLNL